jgi:hypothetical protein
MDRSTKQVKLSCCNVEIVSYITWGEQERIQGVIAQIADLQTGTGKLQEDTMFNYKKNAIRIAVRKIVENETEVPFSYDWLENLSIDDGNKLWNEVEAILTKKK